MHVGVVLIVRTGRIMASRLIRVVHLANVELVVVVADIGLVEHAVPHSLAFLQDVRAGGYWTQL